MRLWRFLPAVLLIGFPALPSFAQADPPGWTADAKNGCRVRNTHPQPNESVTWSGACENGLAQGKGIAQWLENGQPGKRLEGEFRDGKRNGHGVFTAATGDRYEGEYRDGKRNGHGVETRANGLRYEGEFRDGKRNGHGVLTLANGARSEGEWRDGKLIGPTSQPITDTPISPQQAGLSDKSVQKSENNKSESFTVDGTEMVLELPKG